MSGTSEPQATSGDGGGRSPYPPIVVITLGDRFLDAHEIPQRDFNVVTRPHQRNNTQHWVLTPAGRGIFTIMQISSGRYLDAHEIDSLDYRVVTRPQQNNPTQQWQLRNIGGYYHQIIQVSSGRFLTAHLTSEKDFQVVTRPEGAPGFPQQWQVLDLCLVRGGSRGDPDPSEAGTPTG